jgi:hypothetical protein
MTAPHIVDPARLLDQAVSDASPDLIRQLLGTVINALLSAEADAVCGAEYGQASPGAPHPTQRLPTPRPRHPDRHHRGRHPEAQVGLVLS